MLNDPSQKIETITVIYFIVENLDSKARVLYDLCPA